MKKLLTVILLLLSSHPFLWAQKGLAIQAAFDELAIKKNATEVVMSGKRLKDFHLSLFHSLEIKNPSAADRQRITSLVQTDAAQAITQEETSASTSCHSAKVCILTSSTETTDRPSPSSTSRVKPA